MKSRYRIANGFLRFWTLFIGLGAVWGAACMLLRPDGSILHMQGMLPYFQVLPFAEVLFQDYVFPGIALLCVNGLPNLLAAALLLGKKPLGDVLGCVLGCTLIAWICIQFVIFPANFLSISYFIFGLAQAGTGYAAWVFRRQEAFTVNPADYPNVGTDPGRLVVYFSRMGYGRRLAYEEANRTGAALYEITTPEHTAGTLGFWWCGRFGMHQWAMPIAPVALELAAYRHVTICSPIWVFTPAGPVRSFCQQAAGKVRQADYILVHYQNLGYSNAVETLDRLLGVTHTAARSVCCRQGRYLHSRILA